MIDVIGLLVLVLALVAFVVALYRCRKQRRKKIYRVAFALPEQEPEVQEECPQLVSLSDAETFDLDYDE